MTEAKKTRSEIKREAILCGAMQCFHNDGVNNTSMDKIAEIAQVSKRTVYNHFESKEVLVAEILGNLLQNSFSKNDVAYDPDRALNAQLTELINAHMQVTACADFIDLVRVAFGYFMNNPEYMEQHFQKYMPKEMPVSVWLKAAMADGKVKNVDAEFAAEQLMSMIKGQSFWPQLMRQMPVLTDEQRLDLIENSVAMFLNYYQV